MLDNKKIRMMTKLAIYEQNEGKEDIKMAKFYKGDYVRYHIIKTAVSVTVAYLLILLMIGIYNSEYLISKAVTLDYKNIGTLLLGIYLIIMVVYILLAGVLYSIHYERSRARLSKYYKRLKNLDKLYNEEKAEN